jgi:hypothetical protein
MLNLLTVHKWAPVAKKNLNWIDTNNQLIEKNIDKIDAFQKKKNRKPMDQYY